MNTKTKNIFHQNPHYNNTTLWRFYFVFVVFKCKILLKITSSFFKVWLNTQKYFRSVPSFTAMDYSNMKCLSPIVSCENPPCIQCVLFGLRWHAVDGCDLHGGLDPWLALIFDLVPICCACHRLQGAFHALMEQLKGRGAL